MKNGRKELRKVNELLILSFVVTQYRNYIINSKKTRAFRGSVQFSRSVLSNSL